jgi:hypothetical protein
MKKPLIIFHLILTVLAIQNASVYGNRNNGETSLLASGQWFKVGVTRTGVYRIDYSKLKQIGLENPQNPRIYSNNNGQLSYYNGPSIPRGFEEIPAWYSKGADGIFNEGDYLLFYASGTHRFIYNYATDNYDFSRHNYSDTAFYFITSATTSGKSMENVIQPAGTPDYFSSSSDLLYSHEQETENLIKSGREWYQPANVYSNITVSPLFSNLILSEPVKYEIRVLGRASIATLFRFQEGESVITSLTVPEVYLLSTTGTFARDAKATGSFMAASQNPSFAVKFVNNGENGAKGWLDYVRLTARGEMIYSGKLAEFADSRSILTGRITRFTVKSTNQSVQIWDVTNHQEPESINYTRSGDNCIFALETDSLRKFVVFSSGDALTPVFRKVSVPNQDLIGSADAEMVIVAHPLFLNYAKKLADMHADNSGLKTLIVTPEQIYNEFSGGVPDIAAIRNFLRMKFEKQSGEVRLKYLLLFGDGSYENKTLPPHNPNFVPTYQSQNSTVIVSSFTSDDFYGLLEPGEGEADGTEDIGIGRFPVADTLSASVLVKKVKKYLEASAAGNWRNTIAIAADDEDGNAHISDAEGLYTLLNSANPMFNVDKIYLDAFKQVTSVNGQSYPDVTRAINDRINAGCLVFNYLGHGNEIGLAHERVVKTENINSWKNGSKLPLFITATCEFSRFDDIEINPVTRDMTGKTSAGEMVLLNPDGGGIALMTTTRVVFSAPNYALNRNIYFHAFERDEKGRALTLGDIIRKAKISSGNGMNKRNFQLLGDPALRLAWPWHGKVVTDSVNRQSVLFPVDTLKALSYVTISGHLEDTTGSVLEDFNGTVSAIVYDKPSDIKTLANDGGPVMEFQLRNNAIFSGKTKANNGKFSFSFIVPRDIRYSFGNGHISYYANEDGNDLTGWYRNIVVGGFSNSTVEDTEGPMIRLFLNDTLFRDGGLAGPNPVLLASLADASGINTTGSGIGHDLTIWLDDNRSNSIILNNFYSTEVNDFTKGTVTYPLNKIEPGSYLLTLKAWDNYNNSNQESIRFIVRNEEGFILNSLINYPNPFTEETSVTAEHNRPDTQLEVIIEIYSMQGKKIRILKNSIYTSGYRLPPVVWDGQNEGGEKADRGIYIYTVTVKTPSGEIARASGRMIIL